MYTKVLTLVALVCSARAGLIGAPALSSIGIAAPAYAGHGYGLAASPAIAAGPFLGGHGFGLAGHAIAAPAIAAAPAIFKAPIAAPAIVKAAAAPAIDYVAYPKYSFNYGVADGHTGDQKTQQEVRDGDVVKGSYSLQEPDGTIRTVHYTADDHNGFNAVVTRSGHAVHPETAHIAKTVVAAAPLAYAAPAKALFAAPAAIASPALAYGGLGHLGGFAYKG